MSQLSSNELIAELRRQAAMKNATCPCVMLKDLMPLCDEYERLNTYREYAQEIAAAAYENAARISGSALLAGERCPAEDKQIIYGLACEVLRDLFLIKSDPIDEVSIAQQEGE